MPEACTCPGFFLAKARIPNSIRTSVDEDFEKRQMTRTFDKIANDCLFKVGSLLERQLALQFQRLYLSLSPSPLFGGMAHLFNVERITISKNSCFSPSHPVNHQFLTSYFHQPQFPCKRKKGYTASTHPVPPKSHLTFLRPKAKALRSSKRSCHG